MVMLRLFRAYCFYEKKKKKERKKVKTKKEERKEKKRKGWSVLHLLGLQ